MRLPLNEERLAKCVNISEVAYYVLSNKLATYSELDTQLTLEDALNLIEIDQVHSHNVQLVEAAQNEYANSR